MELISVFEELLFQCSQVFAFLRLTFDALPLVIQLLVYVSFGGVLFLGVARGLGRW